MSRFFTPLTRAIDRILSRITTYRLVLWSLVAILVVALLLSVVAPLTGDPQLFAPTPFELLATTAVAACATWASTWLIGKLVHVHPNGESAIVTGLILACLYPPTLDLLTLAGIAAGGIIASASKFVIAAQGRHLFNPAALGATVTGLAGAAVPIWWVATPPLLPVALIAGLLLLYRTRKLLMALVFAGTALLVYLPQMLAVGTPVGFALTTFVADHPVVFFAAFMLIEPLTLPPRRSQQFVEAIVVGALAFSIGSIYIGPEKALLVGNLLAFAMSPRLGVRLEFLGRRELTPTTWEYRFRPQRSLRFRPGQYIELEVPHRADSAGTRRVFSISSAPTPGGELTVAAKHGDPSSSYKLALLDLQPGQQLNARWLGGDFVLPDDPNAKVLLIAGGIGITPFASQLASLIPDGTAPRDAVVAYAVRSAAELAYADTLTASGARVLLASPERPTELPTGWEWVGERLTGDLLIERIPDIGERIAYVSGSPGFVDWARSALRGVSRGRVRTDRFTGY